MKGELGEDMSEKANREKTIPEVVANPKGNAYLTPAREGMNSISAMASRQTRLATASETVGRAAENQFHFTPTSASWLNQVEVWFRSCRGSRLAALQKPQAASGTHRCLRQRVQRQSRALRLDQEKGPSTPLQRPPYHSALIPGTRLCENTKPLDRDRMSYSFKTPLGARSENPFNFESNSRKSFSSRFEFLSFHTTYAHSCPGHVRRHVR